jgi:formyl-CoA transferase
MQDAVLNLCRVKMRDQQRLDSVGYLEEYPQYPHEMDAFKDKVVPRGGNAGGGGQPGWILKCKGWQTDPNAYIYFTVQGHAWDPICDALGKPEWKTDPDYMTPKARQPHIDQIFATIEDFIKDKTKFEAVDIFRKHDIPCAPVLSMKELLHDESLRKSGSIVEVPHKERGSYWTIGSPIKFSDLKPEVTASPLLGEHTDEVLAELGYTKEQIANLKEAKAV